jgi:ParB-like nuclease domain
MFAWRDYLQVHSAVELFPALSEAELKELAEDIRQNGLRVPIVVGAEDLDSSKYVLLDGRNRLDALALLGLLYAVDGKLYLKTWTGEKWADLSGEIVQFRHLEGGEPYAFVLSLNVRRRHLSNEQKHDLVANLIKATPEKSNRQIAAQANVVSHPTVAKIRERLEQKGDVEKVTTSIDTKGRKQPARKSKPAARADDEATVERDRKACVALDQKVRAAERELGQWSADHPVEADAEVSAEARKAAYADDGNAQDDDRDSYRVAFLLRADAAAGMASLVGPNKKLSGRARKELAAAARIAAKAWSDLADSLEQSP